MYKSGYLRVSIVLLIILFISYNTVGCQKTKSKESFDFVFMSDIHIHNQQGADDGFRMAIDKINDIDPDFVISGGDLVMDALGVSYDSSMKQFDLYNNLTSGLEAPLYNTIGNHDIFGIYEESGIKPDHPEYEKQIYKNRISYGNTYYSYNFKNWHFIILDVIGITDDNKYFGIVDSLQIEWLKKDLNNIDKDTPITIVGHIPFVTFADQVLEKYPAELTQSLVVTNAHEILKLFEGYNLKLVLQGHLHLVEEMIFKDIHFITGGAVSGNKWKGQSHGFEEGFLLFEVENDNFLWKFIDYGWGLTFTDTFISE